MSKKIIGMFFIFCMTFAFAEEKWATVSIAEQKNFTIPFSLDEENLFPAIPVSIGGVPMKMGIDTCYLGTIMLAYTSLIEKVGGKELLKEVWNGIEEETCRQYPGRTPDNALMQNVIQSHSLFITIPDASINGVDMGSLYANYYNAQEHYDEVKGLDGILGLYFFFNCKNIVIDYRNNTVVVNADFIGGKSVPMRQFGTMAAMVINVDINGVSQDAIVAPSLRGVYLRDAYNKKVDYTDETVQRYAATGTPRKASKKSKDIRIQIGDEAVSCKGYFYPIWEGDLGGHDNMAIMRKINFLGYPVFKGHRIQLDFENWVFRMD